MKISRPNSNTLVVISFVFAAFVNCSTPKVEKIETVPLGFIYCRDNNCEVYLNNRWTKLQVSYEQLDSMELYSDMLLTPCYVIEQNGSNKYKLLRIGSYEQSE